MNKQDRLALSEDLMKMELTYGEIAKKYGVTKQRVGQFAMQELTRETRATRVMNLRSKVMENRLKRLPVVRKDLLRDITMGVLYGFEIAEKYKLNRNTVASIAEKNGLTLKTRRTHPILHMLKCKNCGVDFSDSRADALWCSDWCSDILNRQILRCTRCLKEKPREDLRKAGIYTFKDGRQKQKYVCTACIHLNHIRWPKKK